MKKLSFSMQPSEIILGSIYIPVQILVLPFLVVILNSFIPSPLSEVSLNFALFALNFICVTVIFSKYLIRSFGIFLRNTGTVLITCLKGFGFYWIGSILVNYLVVSIDPAFFNVNDSAIATLTEQNQQLMTVATVLLVPVVEETLYRGLVFGQLYRKNVVIAYIVSVAVFSALHVIGYIGMYSPVRLALCFLQYSPPSVFLAWAYAKADTIWAPILIHMAVNLIGLLAI